MPEQNQVAYPTVTLLGETTTATLTVRAQCATPPSLLHVVIVLDGSSGVTDAARRYEHETAVALIDFPQPWALTLAPASAPSTQR